MTIFALPCLQKKIIFNCKLQDRQLFYHIWVQRKKVKEKKKSLQRIRADGQVYLFFILGIQVLKFNSPGISQTRSITRAKQGPFSIISDSFHKEIRNPESIKEITSPTFFLLTELIIWMCKKIILTYISKRKILFQEIPK